MAVSSTPKMSVRRSANCFKLLSISRPGYSHRMEAEDRKELKPGALLTEQQLSWCTVEAGPTGQVEYGSQNGMLILSPH